MTDQIIIDDTILELDPGPWSLDFESRFWVHANGRIARPGILTLVRDGRMRWTPPKWVEESHIHPAGYIYARWRKNHYWHRVVARAWIPNPEHKSQVHRIDHNRSNNQLSNLQWVTHAENNQASWDRGLRKKPGHSKTGQFKWST